MTFNTSIFCASFLMISFPRANIHTNTVTVGSQMLLFANSASGDQHNHIHLSHTNTNRAIFLRTVENIKFMNKIPLYTIYSLVEELGITVNINSRVVTGNLKLELFNCKIMMHLQINNSVKEICNY